MFAEYPSSRLGAPATLHRGRAAWPAARAGALSRDGDPNAPAAARVFCGACIRIRTSRVRRRLTAPCTPCESVKVITRRQLPHTPFRVASGTRPAETKLRSPEPLACLCRRTRGGEYRRRRPSRLRRLAPNGRMGRVRKRSCGRRDDSTHLRRGWAAAPAATRAQRGNRTNAPRLRLGRRATIAAFCPPRGCRRAISHSARRAYVTTAHGRARVWVRSRISRLMPGNRHCPF